jgi:hypothetical protein
MNPVSVVEYTVNGGGGEPRASFTSDGWIQVPQDANFYTGAPTELIRLNSNTLVPWGIINETAHNAGTSSGPTFARDRFFQLQMWVREQGNDATRQIAGTCIRVAIDDTRYDNVAKGGAWFPHRDSNQLAVASINIQELIGGGGGGCTEILNALTLLYTVAHPNLNTADVTVTGPNGVNTFTLSGTSNANEKFGTATNNFDITTFPKCAYIVDLTVTLRLTDGDIGPGPIYDRLGFCKG